MKKFLIKLSSKTNIIFQTLKKRRKSSEKISKIKKETKNSIENMRHDVEKSEKLFHWLWILYKQLMAQCYVISAYLKHKSIFRRLFVQNDSPREVFFYLFHSTNILRKEMFWEWTLIVYKYNIHFVSGTQWYFLFDEEEKTFERNIFKSRKKSLQKFWNNNIFYQKNL